MQNTPNWRERLNRDFNYDAGIPVCDDKALIYFIESVEKEAEQRGIQKCVDTIKATMTDPDLTTETVITLTCVLSSLQDNNKGL